MDFFVPMTAGLYLLIFGTYHSSFGGHLSGGLFSPRLHLVLNRNSSGELNEKFLHSENRSLLSVALCKGIYYTCRTSLFRCTLLEPENAPRDQVNLKVRADILRPQTEVLTTSKTGEAVPTATGPRTSFQSLPPCGPDCAYSVTKATYKIGLHWNLTEISEKWIAKPNNEI